MAGIYLHIPFCKQACYYCDFHFSTNTALMEEMCAALRTELLLQRDYLSGEQIDTIYFGGGTPSLLPERQLRDLLSTIYEHYRVDPDAEITLEANPDDLSRTKLAQLRSCGINRLSIGVQSFNDELLKFMNRPHDATSAASCFLDARECGFDNISIDLIYAIPGLDAPDWESNVARAIALSPEHISAYSLTIEKGTVFGNWHSKGKVQEVSDEVSAAQMERLVELLEAAGYEHYEVSNFAKPGRRSRHNSSYWQQKKYLGVGPSAHSYDGASRQANIRNNALYIRAIGEGRIPAEREDLSTVDAINDYLLTTLRTSWGSDLHYLRERYGYDLLGARGEYLRMIDARGYATVREDRLTLTRKGRLLADRISADLFLTRE